MVRAGKLKCLFCGTLFGADARNARHQKYCCAVACRKASKAASRRAWLAKPENQDYFRGPENVARVQAWRAAHPGYWRRPELQRQHTKIEARGTGEGREATARRPRESQLRYKISAHRKGLKVFAIRKPRRNLRYKISCAINRLF